MSGTEIRRCKCKHPFQDKTYGKGKRVFNRSSGAGQGAVSMSCTVCGDTQTSGEVARVKAKKK